MILSKIKQFIKENQDDIILVIGVILISLLSFAVGFITARQLEKEPIQFEMTNDQFLISNQIPISNDQNFKDQTLIRN